MTSETCDYSDEFAIVVRYLRDGRYPDGMEKGEKANLRRKCHRNFKLEDGILYYRTSSAGKQNESKAANEDRDWRVCVQTQAERERVMESCHAGVGGL